MDAIKTDRITNINSKREQLKQISKIAKKLQEKEYPELTINEILLNILYQPKNKKASKLTFDTFNGWREKGMRVKKGEKAYLIWGKKRKALQQESEKDEKEDFNFFPLAFVFSSSQVECFKTSNKPIHEDEILNVTEL